MQTLKEDSFEIRKQDHIRYALSEDSQSLVHEDWERIFLIPEALPEINFEEVELRVNSLGQEWKTPFFVSSMTGGHSESFKINSILAEACEAKEWLLGVGSQRREIDDLQASQEWYQLRKKYPKVLLASNIGLSQLIQAPLEKIQKLVEHTEAKALFVHTNPLQECLQMEGTPHFKGGFKALESIVKKMEVPIVIKEVGSGISTTTIQRLSNIGISAVDVSGRGGTHWGRVEGLRSPQKSLKAQAAVTFKDWGLSTPKALYLWAQEARLFENIHSSSQNVSNIEVWASGGVRNGLQAAKSLALGAQRVGLARPFLEAALVGPEAVMELIDLLEYELKISLFCLGIKKISEMKQRKVWLWEKV